MNYMFANFKESLCGFYPAMDLAEELDFSQKVYSKMGYAAKVAICRYYDEYLKYVRELAGEAYSLYLDDEDTLPLNEAIETAILNILDRYTKGISDGYYEASDFIKVDINTLICSGIDNMDKCASLLAILKETAYVENGDYSSIAKHDKIFEMVSIANKHTAFEMLIDISKEFNSLMTVKGEHSKNE